MVHAGRERTSLVRLAGGGLLRVATIASVLLPRRINLIGLHTQPHGITAPVDAGFAPAGKKFKIIGAVNGISPFPVANSPETTPHKAAEEATSLRPKASRWVSGAPEFLRHGPSIDSDNFSGYEVGEI